MPRPPKNPPQTDDEMALSVIQKSGLKAYRRSETIEANEKQIQKIVSVMTEGMKHKARENGKIKLSDTWAVKEITIRYMEICAENAALPTMAGLSQALGVSREALYDHVKRHPQDETSRWIRDTSDTFGEILMQSALSGTVSAIPAIFTAKARYGWREDDSGFDRSVEPLPDQATPEAIAEKYSDLPE